MTGGYALANFFFRRWFSELPSIQRAHRAQHEVLEPTIPIANLGEPLGRIDNRYELLSRLGRGATGDVFKAQGATFS